MKKILLQVAIIAVFASLALCQTQPSVSAMLNADPNGIFGNIDYWSALGQGLDNGVCALTVYNGKLIVGGDFTIAGGAPANYIAAWDGISWSNLGSGVDNGVRALTIYNNRLIVGGVFATAGGIPTGCIAAWNDTSWSEIGAGVGWGVLALTTYDSQLIAGGVISGGVVAYDGFSWSPLGSGVSHFVYALTVYDDTIYGSRLIAGGFLNSAGGAPVKNIAAWDGSNWMPLDTGLVGPVWALAVYKKELIAGESGLGVARWNGSSWSSLASGCSVRDLTVYGDRFIAGGSFSLIGGVQANNIAAWDASKWSPIGSGMNGLVEALYVYDDKLVAGGVFTTAGNVNANNIATWHVCGDVSGDGRVNALDITYLINYLYKGGPKPHCP